MKIVNGKIDWSIDRSVPIVRGADYYNVSEETKAAIERNVSIHGGKWRHMITDVLAWREKEWAKIIPTRRLTRIY